MKKLINSNNETPKQFQPTVSAERLKSNLFENKIPSQLESTPNMEKPKSIAIDNKIPVS